MDQCYTDEVEMARYPRIRCRHRFCGARRRMAPIERCRHLASVLPHASFQAVRKRASMRKTRRSDRRGCDCGARLDRDLCGLIKPRPCNAKRHRRKHREPVFTIALRCGYQLVQWADQALDRTACLWNIRTKTETRELFSLPISGSAAWPHDIRRFFTRDCGCANTRSGQSLLCWTMIAAASLRPVPA